MWSRKHNIETMLGISEEEFEATLMEDQREFYRKAIKNVYDPDYINKKSYERAMEIVKPNDRKEIRD